MSDLSDLLGFDPDDPYSVAGTVTGAIDLSGYVKPDMAKGTTCEHRVPSIIGSMLYKCMMAKGAGHKYIRRVPSGNAKRPWKYFYTVAGGKGLGHTSEMKVGSKFAVKDQGKAGHFEVSYEHEDGHLTIKHDESGTEHKIHKHALATMLHNEHAEAIKTSVAAFDAKQAAAKARALKDLADARGAGAVKHAERLKKEAVLNGASEDEVATEAERKAKADAESGKADKAANVKHLTDIYSAADALSNALQEAHPNGRDYYTHGPSAINTAQDERNRARSAVGGIETLLRNELHNAKYGESHIDADELAKSAANIKDVSLSIHPAVHGNGSGAAALTKQYTDVVDAAKSMVSKLEGVAGQEKALGVAKSIVKEYEYGLAVVKARAAGEVEPVKKPAEPAKVEAEAEPAKEPSGHEKAAREAIGKLEINKKAQHALTAWLDRRVAGESVSLEEEAAKVRADIISGHGSFLGSKVMAAMRKIESEYEAAAKPAKPANEAKPAKESVKTEHAHKREIVPATTGDRHHDQMRQAHADAKLFSDWAKTLSQKTLEHAPSLVTKFKASPLADSFTLERTGARKQDVSLIPKADKGGGIRLTATGDHGDLIRHIAHYADLPESDHWATHARSAESAAKDSKVSGRSVYGVLHSVKKAGVGRAFLAMYKALSK